MARGVGRPLAAYEAKVAARAGRNGRAKGKRTKPPEGTPRGDEQSNLSDPDSRLIRKSRRHEFRPSGAGTAVKETEPKVRQTDSARS